MGLPDSLKTGQGKPEFRQIFNYKEASIKIWKKLNVGQACILSIIYFYIYNKITKYLENVMM